MAWAATVCAVAACSASQSRSDAGSIQMDGAVVDLAPPPADAAGNDDAIPAGGFITGDVDGVTVRAEMGAAAFRFDGLQTGWIEAAAHTSEWTWIVAFVNGPGAKAACGGGNIILQPIGAGMASATYHSGGACMDEVTHPAPNVGDWLDGTFTATLVTTDGATKKMVTNGAFHVPRIADQ